MECCKTQLSLPARLKLLMDKKFKKEVSQEQAAKKVALVGSPNVGKSVIFNGLTGAYVTVSNYPGTTVEVTRGFYRTVGKSVEIIDTPGMYSIIPITEEERVTRKLLLDEKPDIIIHVIDAKNIERMLPLTLQLMEAGFPVILVLNIMDEAKALGVSIDCAALGDMLGVPVVEASAALNVGIDTIRKRIEEKVHYAA